MSLPSYHNYTFNSTPINQQPTDIDSHHLLTQPPPTINYNLHTPTPDHSNNPFHSPTDYPSDSSSDDYSFLCNKEERQRNLPFGDIITNNKEHDHSRIIFQNVNSLELSSGHHTLELVCDSIGQFEIDIACLAETNTIWKHQSSKTSFQATKKDTGNTHIRLLLKQTSNGMTFTNQGALPSLPFHQLVPVLLLQAAIQQDLVDGLI